MGDLNFAHGITEFKYEKFGIYIPFMHHMYKELLKLCREWDDESRLDHFDERYKNNRDMIPCPETKGKWKETFNLYIQSLSFYDNTSEYDLSRIMMTFSDILQVISSDNDIKIGKYLIKHGRGFFGYDDDYEMILDEEYVVYCNDEIIFKAYNSGSFDACIDKIVEHAGGFESYKMLE